MKVIVVGSGNAALCAGISALEKGAEVLMLEAANEHEAGGNSKYTAGAMRFVYNSNEDLYPLLNNPQDERIPKSEFGAYPASKFENDLLGFNDGQPLTMRQRILIDQSYSTMHWLSDHNVKFEPIYSRQCFERDGKFIFWGGLTLAADGEGVGLVESELMEYERLGGVIKYNAEVIGLLTKDSRVIGVEYKSGNSNKVSLADAVILGCGGFEANSLMREKYIGANWKQALVRGTRFNMGKGIEMALNLGAAFEGNPMGCHAVPMDMNMPNYGNLEIPFLERKRYRKICYFLGIMINALGERFVDEGVNFRNYTYAQFGRAILEQPDGFAWQIFDSKVEALLYDEYRFELASFIESDTIEGLIEQMNNVDQQRAYQTIREYNEAVDESIDFEPSILDGKSTRNLKVNKTNWANKLDQPPFKAFPVACGITFTYGGLKINKKAEVLNEKGEVIDGLFACGELVGGVFINGYPGGSGLTSGAVFGRIAGESAAQVII